MSMRITAHVIDQIAVIHLIRL